MEYVTTILDQLTSAVEQSRLRSEAFQRAGRIPGLVDLLLSVDRIPDIRDRILSARSANQWAGAIPLHEPVGATIPPPPRSRRTRIKHARTCGRRSTS